MIKGLLAPLLEVNIIYILNNDETMYNLRQIVSFQPIGPYGKMTQLSNLIAGIVSSLSKVRIDLFVKELFVLFSLQINSLNKLLNGVVYISSYI